MKAVKALGIVVLVYVGIVIAFECLVTFMGKRQADSGVGSDEQWLVITTADADGSEDTVIAGVESGGALYVSANHWPRGWYRRAIANPNVVVTRAGTNSRIARCPSPAMNSRASNATTACRGRCAY